MVRHRKYGYDPGGRGVTNTIAEGRKPSTEEVFYKKWGEETLKESIATLNGIFRLFITLETGLLSAYLGFYDKLVLSPSWLKVIPAALVIMSFIISIIGIYPFAAKVNLSVPEDVKAYKQKRAKFKGRCLTIASVALIAGFISLLIARLMT
jgi:hypothetical protein